MLVAELSNGVFEDDTSENPGWLVALLLQICLGMIENIVKRLC
jgi:hypothetical protein